MTDQRTWRKSTRSADTSTCVEVSNRLDGLRDSKNPSGGILAVPIASFVTTLKRGKIFS